MRSILCFFKTNLRNNVKITHADTQVPGVFSFFFFGKNTHLVTILILLKYELLSRVAMLLTKNILYLSFIPIKNTSKIIVIININF